MRRSDLLDRPLSDARGLTVLRVIDLNLNVAPILDFAGLDAPSMLHDPSIAIIEDVAFVGE
jgi:hypothetical protein